jgi:hypothetical protein
LELSWSGFWSNFTVSLDGTPLGTLPRGQSLKDGQEFRLPDGSIIHIQLIQKPTGNYLEVLRDDKPLPGSDTNPRTILNTAAGVIYFFSGVNLLVGIIAVLFNVQWLQDYGIGFGSIIIGFIYLPLAYFTGEGSSIALLLAVLLYIVDGVAGIVLSIMAGGVPAFGGIVFRVVLLIPMFRGFGAITKLKESGDL